MSELFVKTVALQLTVSWHIIKEIQRFISKLPNPSYSCVNLYFYLYTDRKCVAARCYQILVLQASFGNKQCQDNSQGT